MRIPPTAPGVPDRCLPLTELGLRSRQTGSARNSNMLTGANVAGVRATNSSILFRHHCDCSYPRTSPPLLPKLLPLPWRSKYSVNASNLCPWSDLQRCGRSKSSASTWMRSAHPPNQSRALGVMATGQQAEEFRRGHSLAWVE